MVNSAPKILHRRSIIMRFQIYDIFGILDYVVLITDDIIYTILYIFIYNNIFCFFYYYNILK